jgi:hypothetical protein
LTRTAIVTDAPDDNLLMPRGAAFVQGLVWRVVLHANRFQDIPMLPGAIVRVAFVALAAAACHQSSVTTPPRPTSRSAGQRDEITRKDFEPLLSQPDAIARDRRRSPTHGRVRSTSAHPSLDQ